MTNFLKENIRLAYEEIFPFKMKESIYNKILPLVKNNYDNKDPINSLTKIIIVASTGRNAKKAFLNLENTQSYKYKNKLSYYEDIVKHLNHMLYLGYTYKQAMNKILESIPEDEAHDFSLWHDYKYGRDKAMYKPLAAHDMSKTASFLNDNSGSLWVTEKDQHSLIKDDSANQSLTSGGSASEISAKAKNEKIDSIRIKMLSRVRSLENLLENNLHLLNEELVGKIESTINALKSHVRNIKHARSAIDCLIKHANLLKKQSWEQGAYHLIALADELDGKLPVTTPPPTNIAAPVADATSVNDTNESPSDILGKPKKSPFTASELESMLNQLTDLSIALKRRDLVREIASIDIALHNNNMAAFFPEISDALSRLIDAYSYSSNKIESSLQKLRSASSNQLSEEEEVRIQRQTNKEVANQLAAPPKPQNQTPAPPIQQNTNIKS